MLDCCDAKQDALIPAEISTVLDCSLIRMYTKFFKRKSDENARAEIKDQTNEENNQYI